MENTNSRQLQTGLTEKQVQERIRAGQINISAETGTKTIGQIIFDNVFTFFNLVNLILAALIIYVGSYKNLLFLGVVILNTFIGIFQEIKAKSTIDKLSLLAKSGVTVLRDGIEKNLPDEALVVDDIIVLSSGQQIPADAVVLDGNLEVNESLLTGESEPVIKKTADELLSGSFIISGQAKAKVTHVGAESYTGKISSQVKVTKNNSSEIQSSVNILIKAIAVSLIPIGLILFLKEYLILHLGLSESILDIAAALISLIPSGLVLLTSAVFVISVIKLSRYKTLVQERTSAETLARVDVLCLDKTGTITEGTISLDKIIPIEPATEKTIINDLVLLADALEDDNPTMMAVKNYTKNYERIPVEVIKTIPFSSARKYSGASFKIGKKVETLIMGAGSFVLGDKFKDYQKLISQYAEDDNRILVLASSTQVPEEMKLPEDLKLIGILILSDIIRPEAKQTLDYFEQQGVKLKIISGDDPKTAAAIAAKAGLDDADKYVDATTLKTDQDIKDNIEKYNVFGRVTPEQKKKFILALKKKGHTVAMTGDGVNDVLALKEADTSIAMASGSGASRAIADLVLIDSNFSSLPKIVAEGRMQINNLQRSSALYIAKTVFSVLSILTFMFLAVSYPFVPIQLTLVNTFTIGIPSVVLALEPNTERIKGRFFSNVLDYALPAGITFYVGVILANLIGYLLGYDENIVSTLSVIAMACGGFILIFDLCRPFNILRTALVIFIIAGFSLSILFFGSFFSMVILPVNSFIVLIGILVVEWFLYKFLEKPKVTDVLTDTTERWFNKLGKLVEVRKKSV